MGACAAASVAIGLYYAHASSAPLPASSAGFDLAQVDSRPVAGGSSYVRPGLRSSPLPLAGDDTVIPTGPYSASKHTAASAYDRQTEAEFLANHGAELSSYQARLSQITGRYYKTSAAVRAVDADFAGMDRYMAVKRRYDRDGDPFSFTRDALALPEVRAEIVKKIGDVDVWKAAFGMINEALKDPPPPSVYDEAKLFFKGDPQMTQSPLPHIGNAI